jgi:hypothetical protein
MKKLLCYVCAGVASVLAGCNIMEEPAITSVQGVLLNKYTRQPLAGIPIVVRRWHYGLGGSGPDSIAGTHTDADGRYRIGFSAPAKAGFYRVDFRNSRQLFDLTDYSRFTGYAVNDGAPVETGEANTVDFEATPLVPVRVELELSKDGAATLAVDASANEGDGLGYFHAFTFTDTTRTRQSVSAVATGYFVPNRTYTFSIYRSAILPASYPDWRRFDRRIGYNDTTVVRIR